MLYALALLLVLAVALKVHANAAAALAEHAAKEHRRYKDMVNMYMRQPVHEVWTEQWAYRPVWAEVTVPHLRGGDADKLMERARRRVKENICIELDKCGYFKERTEDLGYATRLHMRLLVCHPKDVKQSRT